MAPRKNLGLRFRHYVYNRPMLEWMFFYHFLVEKKEFFGRKN